MFSSEVVTGGVEGVATWKLFLMRHRLNRWSNGLTSLSLSIMFLGAAQAPMAAILSAQGAGPEGLVYTNR